MGWLLQRGWPLADVGVALRVGLAWLVMTIAFEFGFGHYVAGHSWQRLWADYDLRRGRVWGLFVAWLALVPPLVYLAGQRAG